MKKSDIAMIVFISAVSLLIAYFVMSSVLGKTNEQKAKVRTVTAISSEIVQPNPLIFNRDAINPTVQVLIGQDLPKE